jgi:hypothetical protein
MIPDHPGPEVTRLRRGPFADLVAFFDRHLRV